MKIGLVLGGGGAKGSYQLGVIKALNEYKLLKKLKYISGTSIGAFNACLLMGNMKYEKMMSIWKELDNKNVYAKEQILKNERHGIFDQDKIYEVLTTMQDPKTIKKSKIEGFVVASEIKDKSFVSQINIKNMKEKIFHLNEIENPHQAVLASASIPIVFGATEIDGKTYVDGGVLNNVPINIMNDNLVDVIFVVGLNPIKNLDEYYQDNLIINFSPYEKLSKTFLGILNFDEESIDYYSEVGYKNAIKVIENLIKQEVIIKNKINHNKKGIYNYDFMD